MRCSIKIFFVIPVLLGILLSAPVSTAQAQLSFPAEINKSFSPISIVAGQTSRLSVTIFNPNGFQLISVAWNDNLVGVQPGIRIANPVNLTNTCGGTVTAVAGTTTLSLSGGTVPAQAGVSPGSCTVSIDVTSTTPGNLINTIPAGGLSSTDPTGVTVITNTTPASATLRVGAVQAPSLSKTFTPNTIWVGQTSQLAITIRNNDLNTALTQTTLTDTLPANLVLANPVASSLTGCGSATLTGPGGVPLAPGATAVTLNNGTISANGSCVIRVNVTSTIQGVYTNTIPAGPAPGAIQTQQGVTNASAATAPINVQAIGISKAFNPTSIQAGGTSTLTITLQNPSNAAYTGVSVSDTLPGTVLTVVPGTAATTCGGTVSTTLPRTVSLTGGTIPASATPPTPLGTCTITVQVTAPAGSTTATYTNTIPASSMTTDQGATNLLAATAPLGVYTAGTGVTGTKSFSPSPILAGGNSRLRIDINAPADTSLTNFSITDALPAGLTISNSTAASRTGCGGASVLTAATGSNTITLTGGTINPGTVCRIDVYVTGSIPGVYNNVIPPSNITNAQGRTTAGNISASLTIQAMSDLTISKAFFPGTVNPNGLSTLTITLRNTNTSPLVNVSLLDTLPGSTTNGVVVAPTPNASTTCTSGGSEVLTATPGTLTISLANGTVPAQVGAVPGICTINVDVQGKGSAATRTNTIPVNNVSGTIQSTGTVINPQAAASANLVIGNLTIGVVKGFNPLTVFGGSASTLSIQLVNPNNAVLSGIAFTDTMPAGMIIANPPNLDTGSCGGTLIGTPGASSFSFSGGSLAAATSCTLTLSTTMTVNGNLTNQIPANAVTTFNGVKNPQAAEASLTNLPGASISKFFSPDPIAAGLSNYSLLTITIQNTSSFSLTGLGLIDNLPGTLPAGLQVAGGVAPAPVNNCGGTLTAAPGTQAIQLSGGNLAGASSCTLVIPVTSTTAGSYLNTIPAGTLTNNEGATNNEPATDTLLVIAPPSISKSFLPNPIAAGGTSTLTFTITNSNASTALTGVAFTDALPNGVTLAANVASPQCGGTLTGISGGNTITLTNGSIPANGSCTITTSVTASASGSYVNTTGNVTSTNGGTGNTATSTLSVVDLSPVKSLVTTSEPSTTVVATTERVTIGEMIRYRISTILPEGTFTNVQFIDGLPNGLQFLNDGTAKVAFVCNGDTDCIQSSTITGPGLVINGASNNVTPAFPLPGSTISGGPFGSGTNITFSVGNLENTDLDSDSEFVVIEFNAIVMNVNATSTINQGIDNLTGASITNSRGNDVSLFINGSMVGSTSPNVNVSVAEPSISVINKSVSPAPYYAGDIVTYLMTFTNNATGNNATTAFDIVLNDVLDNNLTVGPVSISGTQGATCAGGTPFSTSHSTAGQTVSASVSCLNPGSSVTVTVNATINPSVTSGTSISNNASLTYSSLPGPQGNCASAPFACSAVGTSGSSNGERNGSQGSGADATVLNNYAVTSNTTIVLVSATPTLTDTPTSTFTPTASNTPTATVTYTPTDTPTVTPTGSPSATPSPTTTTTATATATGTSTSTPTHAQTTTSTPSPTVTSTPSLFDPPFGVKAFDDSGLPILQWTMVWINNSNTVAVNSLVSDEVPVGATYLVSGVSSGFPVPASAPAGSTNVGVSCTDTSAVTVTTLCYYEGPTTPFPRGRIIWAGTLGPDPGATNAANTDDEITITFHLDINDGVNSVRNRATLDADLNNDGDTTDPGEQQVATASATWRRSTSKRLPSTGFAPHIVTDIRQLPRETYIQVGDISLDIPSLHIDIPIVGVPSRNGDWNVSWLGRQAGWLEGSSFPTWNGNSVLTSHVYLSNGSPGPFVSLSKLKYGDKVVIHAYGQKYTFEVRSNETVNPNDTSAFQHEERPWLTLVTCKEYDEKTNTYRKRVVVRAVLISVTDE